MRNESSTASLGWRVLFALTASLALIPMAFGAAPQTVINGPLGSGKFGDRVVILPNGNLVVVDPTWNTVGAVYLLRPDGTQISVVTGGTPNDFVGQEGITVLPSGNFLIKSINWQNAGAPRVGAVTFVDGRSGLNGVVSAANSLIGNAAESRVGVGNVIVLVNGNYVVVSPNAVIAGITNAGAVTWGSGQTGVIGTVSAANSLVGGSDGDFVGLDGVTGLTQGHYVVQSPLWTNPTTGIDGVGAATWCNGNIGCVGPVTSANSLTGSQGADLVGTDVLALPNGNYVVGSSRWANGGTLEAGAATWCNGASGRTGVVSVSNSLVGSNQSDAVGASLRTLANGHYAVLSAGWSNGAAGGAGAVTWGNGSTGTNGVVSTANSIVGTSPGDHVGFKFLALSNGHYLVGSDDWDNGAEFNAGALRWANADGSSVGALTAANALVGTRAGDFSQSSVIEVGVGNYLILAPSWDNGPAATNAGAAVWGDGTFGAIGAISAANALVGVRSNDVVGTGAVRLATGHYVVRSPGLSTATTSAIGAATWGNGSSGTTGIVSSANSLVGVRSNDRVGSGAAVSLANGHYMIGSENWNSATNTGVGAVTWGDGVTGTIGEVAATNSLTGSKISDAVGSLLTPLPNSRVLVGSGLWDNASQINTGAFTLLDGNTPISGFSVGVGNSFIGTAAENRVGNVGQIVEGDNRIPARVPLWDTGVVPVNTGAVCLLDGNAPLIGAVNASDCVLGTVAGGGASMNTAYELTQQMLVVGIPAENKIVIFGNRLLSDSFE
ncbi:MAG: hypothetical protein IPP28_16720 [Xanthomonadales bacterium]|nr:hypothetical protein [Xanthomonadales bacterium]